MSKNDIIFTRIRSIYTSYWGVSETIKGYFKIKGLVSDSEYEVEWRDGQFISGDEFLLRLIYLDHSTKLKTKWNFSIANGFSPVARGKELEHPLSAYFFVINEIFDAVVNDEYDGPVIPGAPSDTIT
ncbi:hypothetical protein [Listeria booriae]|uniref:Uncharacterized protein n=1 Tax=Listeria booriae TaxID=1552123 RepID=A0A842ETD9_9LIST|nr:hypothetical protein [Listeria booriae]MBC2242370.1 hypothetical protein [Listeria booriae]